LPTNAQEQPALNDAFDRTFLIGTALNRAQISEEDTPGVALMKAQFNAITPENILHGIRSTPHPVHDFAPTAVHHEDSGIRQKPLRQASRLGHRVCFLSRTEKESHNEKAN
jgi:hypothetical protein